MIRQNIHHFFPDLSRESESVRRYAARMLGIESEEQIVPFLLDALESADPQVRREAVRALGEIKDPAALDGLSAALGDDDEETREGAARCLGLLNTLGGVPVLAGALSGSSSVVRAAAAGALSWMAGFMSWQDTGVDAREAMLRALLSAVPALVAVLHDDNEDVSVKAARALGSFDSGAESHLLDALDQSSDRVRCQLVLALGRLKAPESVPMLLELMEDVDYGVRYDACSALKGMKVSQAVPAFIGGLRDSDSGVRSISAEALGDMGDRQAVPALIAALDEWDRNVRLEVIDALGRLGDREAVPALLSVVRDPRGVRPRPVGYALARLGGDQAWEGIVAAVEGGYIPLSPGIARMLGESGYVRAMPRLRGLLDADDGYQCWCDALALKGLGDTVTGPEMLEELGSDVPWRRARAAWSLGALGGPESVEPLIEALGDDRDCMREAAAFALGEMDDSRAAGPLTAAASDESEGVRRRGAVFAGEAEHGAGTCGAPLALLCRRTRSESIPARRDPVPVVAASRFSMAPGPAWSVMCRTLSTLRHNSAACRRNLTVSLPAAQFSTAVCQSVNPPTWDTLTPPFIG